MELEAHRETRVRGAELRCETRMNWIEWDVRRCVSKLFFFFFFFNFGRNWQYGPIRPESVRIGLIQSKSAWVCAELVRVGKRKKKWMRHWRVGNGVACVSPCQKRVQRPFFRIRASQCTASSWPSLSADLGTLSTTISLELHKSFLQVAS